MNLAAQYARAIYDVRKEKKLGDAELAAFVTEALKRRRREKLLPKILEEYREIDAQAKEESVVLRLASEKERAKGLSILKKLGMEHAHSRTVVDPALVRGFVIAGKDFRYDASAKRTLVDLYKRLTATH